MQNLLWELHWEIRLGWAKSVGWRETRWRAHWRQRRGLSPIWCRPVIRTGPEPDFRRKVTGGWSWKSSKLSWEEEKDEGLVRSWPTPSCDES